MIAHLRYLSYVLRHKWYVVWVGVPLGVPFWRLLVHDWTKFTRTEWTPYVNRFYGKNAYRPGADNKGYLHKPGEDIAFDQAWQHHWQKNPHHWNYWYRPEEDGSMCANWMPSTYVREMVADWIAAGMAQGKPDVEAWYLENKDRIILHDGTRYLVTQLIKEAQRRGLIPTP